MKYSEVTEVIRWYPSQFKTINETDIWGTERIDMYVHIPFCLGKCGFCPFNSIPINNQNLDEYFDILFKEINLYAAEGHFSNKQISSLWIGGGTPSAVPFKQILSLLELLHSKFIFTTDAEITLESNLYDLKEEYIKDVAQSQITRLSIGVQSFDDKYLKMGGRTYNSDQVKEFFSFVRKYDIDVSIDLMYRYPGQTFEEVSKEIDILVANLEYIDHITLYPLILFPRLSFFKQIIAGILPKQCNLKTYEKMNLLYSKRLREHGFKQYTSYHFARPGKENRYNLDRWGFPQLECVAFGPGAFGQIKGYVYCNEHKIADYYEKVNSGIKPVQQGKRINLAENISRYLVLGTKCRFVDLALFREMTGFDLKTLYGDGITMLIAEGLIEILDDTLFVTDKGCTYIVDVNRVFQTENNQKFTQPQYYILDMMDVQSGHTMSDVIEGDKDE